MTIPKIPDEAFAELRLIAEAEQKVNQAADDWWAKHVAPWMCGRDDSECLDFLRTIRGLHDDQMQAIDLPLRTQTTKAALRAQIYSGVEHA